MLVRVALPYRIAKPLIYELTGDQNLTPGCRVVVPLGKREVVGCLLGEAKGPPPPGLKPITEILDHEPLFTPAQMKLLSWASRYYLTPIGEVMRHLAPAPLLKKKRLSLRPTKPFLTPDDFLTPAPSLSVEQEAVMTEILKSAGPFLLHGITGSGKTEIYLQLARQILQQGGEGLILVPGTGATPQLIGRFEGVFPNRVSPYHSRLTEAQRLKVWLKVRSGEAPLVIGTRSAIFLPFTNLRLIVVDEEHDTSYKQEERFCYHARDLALWRAKEEKAIALLGSATPSLESLYRSETGKLKSLRLASRPEGTALPEVVIVDRREQPRGVLFSAELKSALQENLSRGEQSLLFLNRRGYAPYLLCRKCGFVPQCTGCEIALTYHKKASALLCHYCDSSVPLPAACPSCRQDSLQTQGIGTEKVEWELAQLFPKARLARLDRDTSQGSGWLETLSRMKRREIDILIGTQTVAKGHDYPELTLVGVIDADTSLHLPDFRAAERTFQLLTQVAGRAGRGKKAGRVIIQTYHPDHPSLVAAQQQEGKAFRQTEFGYREEAGYPPYTRLVRILFSGPHRGAVEKAAHQVANQILRGTDRSDTDLSFKLLGPAPCPLARLRGKSRWHLLIKSRSFTQLHPHLESRLDPILQNGLPSGVKMLVNVDPVEMI